MYRHYFEGYPLEDLKYAVCFRENLIADILEMRLTEAEKEVCPETGDNKCCKYCPVEPGCADSIKILFDKCYQMEYLVPEIDAEIITCEIDGYNIKAIFMNK